MDIDGVSLERFTRLEKLLSGKEEQSTHQVMVRRKRRDPRKGTGKKPKGSDRRLYTDENPKDTVSIKYATVQDAKDTIKKVININKPYARKIQILTVLEQRAKVAGKFEQARLAKAAKLKLKRMHDGTSKKSKKS